MQNQAIITGRLTKEGDLESVNDHSLVRFTLATSRDYKAADNTYPTDFIDACLWGTPAERFVSLVHKGDVVQITGRLQPEPIKTQTAATTSAQRCWWTSGTVSCLNKKLQSLWIVRQARFLP